MALPLSLSSLPIPYGKDATTGSDKGACMAMLESTSIAWKFDKYSPSINAKVSLIFISPYK